MDGPHFHNPESQSTSLDMNKQIAPKVFTYLFLSSFNNVKMRKRIFKKRKQH